MRPDENGKLAAGALTFLRSQAPDQCVSAANCVQQVFAGELEDTPSTDLTDTERLLLDEGADKAHAAAAYHEANHVAGAARFLELEIALRKKYLASCGGQKQRCPRYDYNYTLTLQAYDHLGRGSEANDWMIETAADGLRSQDALKLWLKALYSCPNWNMKPALKDSLYVGDGLCTDSCRDSALAARGVLGQIQSLSASMKPMISRFNHQVDACSAAQATLPVGQM